MNARSLDQQWLELNQRWLAARFAALARRIAPRLHALDAAVAPPAFAPDDEHLPWPELGAPPALEHLARLFGLSRFEAELLLLAAGVELDRGLRALLPGGISFSLAMTLLEAPHWDAMSPMAPLRRWRLLRLQPEGTLVHAALAIDERVLHALIGVAACDETLIGCAQFATGAAAAADPQGAQALAACLATAPGGEPPLLLLAAAPGHAVGAAVLRATAVDAVERSGRQALVFAFDDLPVEAPHAAALIDRIDREALLAGATLVAVVDAADPAPEALRRLAAAVERVCSPLLLVGALDVAALRQRLRRRLQRFELAAAHSAPRRLGPAREQGLREALQQFRVDHAGLAAAIDAAEAQAGADDQAFGEALWERLRGAARGGLDALAQRIDSRTTLADLVLPSGPAEQLAELAAQLRHRSLVHETWGFAAQGRRGLGLVALFAGDSGTGKTMAAEAVANAARLDLYRIDLAAVVSKYIGETEKNLARIFDAAEASGAVLLFDEADALFGKRSEVKDSHDRYANIEIAYLLQRIEAYRGLAILTTNLRAALDKAFLRRIRFVVQFPFPDAAAREQIWRRQFGPAAPLGAIDFAALGRLHLAGGHIRAVTLNAAFKAAQARVPIAQPQLLAAAAAEFAKLERSAVGAGATS